MQFKNNFVGPGDYVMFNLSSFFGLHVVFVTLRTCILTAVTLEICESCVLVFVTSPNVSFSGKFRKIDLVSNPCTRQENKFPWNFSERGFIFVFAVFLHDALLLINRVGQADDCLLHTHTHTHI